MHRLILVLAMLASAASAQGLRDGETVLSAADMVDTLKGHTHEFHDGGRSFFSITESYSYTYPDGGIAYGRYEIRDGGVVCTFFNHGFERCDTYVRNGNRLILINQDGLRFPVKSVSGDDTI
ncbi:hypothetical protein [Shimia ponticola]|uniref:hypothetical protein n=1 Tax=Shimia ponticola TaxID=2582893 RepID=UPI0011BD963E|nr:hypothetical protein [Shimia ponticola]